MNVSLCAVVFNEEKRIKEFIEYHKPYFNDIVVVDQMSTDKTAEILNGLGVKLLYDKNLGLAEGSRHIAALNTSNDWILFLDADEFATKSLLDRLSQLIAADYDGYLCERHDYIDGNFITSQGNHYRLFKKQNVRFNEFLHGGSEPRQVSNVGIVKDAINHIKSTEENKVDAEAYGQIILNNVESVSPLWYHMYTSHIFPLESMISMIIPVKPYQEQVIDLDECIKQYNKHFGTDNVNKVVVLDGLNGQQNRYYYEKAKDDLARFCSINNIVFIANDEYLGYDRCKLKATRHIGTPYYLWTKTNNCPYMSVNLQEVVRGLSENVNIKRLCFDTSSLLKNSSYGTQNNNGRFNCFQTDNLNHYPYISYTHIHNFVMLPRINKLDKNEFLVNQLVSEYREISKKQGPAHAHHLFGFYNYGIIGGPAVVYY